MKEIQYTLTENKTGKVIISENSLSQFALKFFKQIATIDPKFKKLVPHKVRAQKNTNRYKICSGEDFTFTGLFIATSKEKVVELNAGTKESKYEYKRWFEDEFYLGDEIVFLSTQWYNDSEDSTLMNKQLRYSELQKLLDTCYSGLYKCNYEVINDRNDMPKATTQQVIYFGAPGTGKSHLVKKLLKDKYGIDEKKKTGIDRLFRTTFHPDTDYSSFVGCYRPTIDKKSGKITYEFNEEVFTKAYIQAWAEYKRNPSNPAPVFLIIEEINRGNCAQIFGDLFQLLDRNDDGFSEYKIKADNALTEHLKNKAPNSLQDDNLCLPPNLNIIATMNTSDQSLFPMDSAFKRRWDWEYIPIKSTCSESNFTITIGEKKYGWLNFIASVNQEILNLSESEDKQLGNFFIKGNIGTKEFKSKVMFYLWSEVCKDYYRSGSFFKYKESEDNEVEFTFNMLFDDSKDIQILQGFMEHLKVPELKDSTPDATPDATATTTI